MASAPGPGIQYETESKCGSEGKYVRLFVGTQMLGMGVWQMDIVLKILKDGLGDRESVDVCF